MKVEREFACTILLYSILFSFPQISASLREINHPSSLIPIVSISTPLHDSFSNPSFPQLRRKRRRNKKGREPLMQLPTPVTRTVTYFWRSVSFNEMIIDFGNTSVGWCVDAKSSAPVEYTPRSLCGFLLLQWTG